MRIAQLGLGGLFARLHGLANRLAGAGAATMAQPPRDESSTQYRAVPGFVPMPSPARCSARTRPHRRAGVRVVRVLEGCSELAVGRIVISGRLDDVCAELDRLAELEAAAH